MNTRGNAWLRQSGICLLVWGAIVVALVASGIACSTTQRVTPGIGFARGERLYKGLCQACHGEGGYWNGPAAIALKVPPRDLRNEPLRYVSGLEGVATQEDMVQTIRLGRRFGEMPAHPQLTDEDILNLAAYVREINRLALVETLTKETAAEDGDFTPEEIEEIAEERVAWGKPTVVVRPGPEFHLDTRLGRKLYMASCASCHGSFGLGDGLDMPLDEQGRPIKVRDLTSGRFRGGTEPGEIFKRIRCGVPGTPMPAQDAMSDEEVWQVVYYTMFLAGSHR